jgi:hypothetical protein
MMAITTNNSISENAADLFLALDVIMISLQIGTRISPARSTGQGP